MIGWIKLHRKLLEWEWYKDSKMVHLFIHLLLSANRNPGEWRGVKVKKGQLITGLKSLSANTGISIQSLRTCIKRLKSTHEITIKSTHQYSIITLCKYEDYQSIIIEDNNPTNIQPNKSLTNDQQTSNNKQERKEDKERKEVYIQIDHLILYKDEFLKLRDKYTKKEIDSILEDIDNYEKNTKYKDLKKLASNWLKGKYPDRPNGYKEPAYI